jgi:hypothetical protein
MQELWPPLADGIPEIGSTVVILDIGTMYHEAAIRPSVSTMDVSLAILVLLARIIAPGRFRGYDTLAIDDTSRGASLPSSSRASITRRWLMRAQSPSAPHS